MEDLELVKDKELNEKLATLLNNFWTLQWKAVSDEVEKASTQGWCIHFLVPESIFLPVCSDNDGQTMQGLIDIESLLENHAQPENYFEFKNEK